LRVLVATDSLSNGGAERQLALTVTNLPDRWDIRCFSVGEGPFSKYLLDRGVGLEIAERRWHYDPLPFLRLWGLVLRWRPHLVHSWGYMTTLAGFPIYRLLGIPYIDGSIRNGDVELTHPSRIDAGFNRATLVVANSRSGLKSAGVTPERGRVIPNGFDFSRLPSTVPERRDGRFTVVMAGRMHPAKDYACFLSAARLLAGSLPEGAVRFRALGDGPDRAHLESEGRDLVESGVLEFGYFPDVVSEVLLADCGVLVTTPSVHLEGCSNAILEYMACALPVIASRGGGTDELVVHGETGFLVAPGNPQEVADRLLWVYSNRVTARAMGAKGSETVRREYCLEAMIRSTELVYAEALARGGRVSV